MLLIYSTVSSGETTGFSKGGKLSWKGPTGQWWRNLSRWGGTSSRQKNYGKFFSL